jgi:light-regulated signal transduction histidine kinase (bacteriophytochrome)
MNTLRLLAANNKFQALLGYAEAELRSMTIEQIRPASDITPLRDRLKQSPPPGLVPSHYVRKDQTLLDVKVHYRNVAYTDDAGDAVTGRLVVVEFWSET